MACSFCGRYVGSSSSSPSSSSACPRPATLPWPKIAHTPGTSRRLAPSRSLYWAARNLTTAWPTVALSVGICAYAYHTAVRGGPGSVAAGGAGDADAHGGQADHENQQGQGRHEAQ